LHFRFFQISSFTSNVKLQRFYQLSGLKYLYRIFRVVLPLSPSRGNAHKNILLKMTSEMSLPANHTSYYSILNLPQTCTTTEIKSAYHKLLLSTHPDKVQTQGKSTSFAIQDIQSAYRALSNVQSRKEYDDILHEHYIKLGVTNSNGAGSGVLIDGIDKLDLSVFEEVENGEEFQYVHACPRCTVEDGFVISEEDLEEDIQHHQRSSTTHTEEGEVESENYQLLIQCAHCSLWICVSYSIS
jgi:diphthamide biosynthesis protein 4